MKPKQNYRLGPRDELMTPGYGIEPLTRAMRQFMPEWAQLRIWECASGEGYMAHALEQDGFIVEVKSTLVVPDKTLVRTIQRDFLNGNLKDFPYSLTDAIVTNPPWSLKKEFMARCIESGKRWALLMPSETISLKWFGELVESLSPQIGMIWFNPRIGFKTPNRGWEWIDDDPESETFGKLKRSSSQMGVAWFTHGLGFQGNLFMRMNHWTMEYRRKFEI